jgi:hypothetical protein
VIPLDSSPYEGLSLVFVIELIDSKYVGLTLGALSVLEEIYFELP